MLPPNTTTTIDCYLIKATPLNDAKMNTHWLLAHYAKRVIPNGPAGPKNILEAYVGAVLNTPNLQHFETLRRSRFATPSMDNHTMPSLDQGGVAAMHIASSPGPHCA